MSNNQFFLIDFKFARGSLHVDPINLDANYISLHRGEYVPETPIVCLRQSGSYPMDLIGTTYAILLLVSDYFLSVLETNRFTGWSLYPVDVYGKNKELVPGYHGLAITGRSGPLNNSGTLPIVHIPRVSGGKPTKWKVGAHIDISTWDGSDFFLPAGYQGVIVVEAVRRALNAAKVKNVGFKPISQLEFPVLY